MEEVCALKKWFSFLMMVCLMLNVGALAETNVNEPMAVVNCDVSALSDWAPSYGLYVPGVLLELTQQEGMLSVTAKQGDMTPAESLSAQLDRAGETLIVSDALMEDWLGGAGKQLSYQYTYPGGDEEHICRALSIPSGGYLIEIYMDCWGDSAQENIDTLMDVFGNHGVSVRFLNQPAEISGTLRDVSLTETGNVQLELELSGGIRQFYALSNDAVLLFPAQDDPSRYQLVSPDMDSLVDAILGFEEISGRSATFQAILQDGVIVYMKV